MFNHSELSLLISGTKTIDIDDLIKNCKYTGYSQSSTTIQYLWVILKEFSEEEKGLFVNFVTSCPRPPTLVN